MTEPNNGEALPPEANRLLAPKGSQARYTGELLLRTRPKTYRAIVRELAEPNTSVNGISRRYRVSNHTVMGIREREAKRITERKNHLVSILADVATLGSERMAEKIGKAGLRDAAIGTGIAVDKMLALTGQMPVGVQVAVVNMPTPEEAEERRRAHHALDEITRLLQKPKTPDNQLLLKVMLKELQLSSPQDEPGEIPWKIRFLSRFICAVADRRVIPIRA